MSIAALYELQERLYQTAIAGVNVIDEDFRLHRSIEQFQQLSGASPVLKRIAEQLAPLRDPEASNRDLLLIDVLALIDAVLITQGPTDVSGELEELSSSAASNSHYYELRYSELHALKFALTTKGAGRYEVVRAALDGKSKALQDFRLQGALIAALGDSYVEIAEMVVEILAGSDPSIIPLLKQQFDPKGKREMARRVEVIEKLAGRQENEFYVELVQQKSSALVKLEAVRALRHEPSNAELLIALAETAKGELREAAFASLYALGVNENRQFWLKHAAQSPFEVADYLFHDIGDDLSDVIASQLRKQLEELTIESAKHEQSWEMTEQQYANLSNLLYMSINKSSKALMKVFADMPQLGEPLLSKVNIPSSITSYGRHYGEMPQDRRFFDQDLVREVNGIMRRGIALNNNRQLIDASLALFEQTGSYYLHAAFCAALVSRPASEVFEQFSPYLHNEVLADVIVTTLFFVKYDKEAQQYRLYYSNYWDKKKSRFLYEQLDSRWIERLVSDETRTVSNFPYLMKQRQYSDEILNLDVVRESYDLVLSGLINTTDAESTELLRQYFIAAASEPYSVRPIYALHRMGVQDLSQWILILFQHPKSNIEQLYFFCAKLGMSREQEIEILRMLQQAIRDNIITHRKFTVEYLEKKIEQLNRLNNFHNV